MNIFKLYGQKSTDIASFDSGSIQQKNKNSCENLRLPELINRLKLKGLNDGSSAFSSFNEFIVCRFKEGKILKKSPFAENKIQ